MPEFQSPWMRGFKISLSFSCPSELFTKIEEFKKDQRMNMSQACCRLVVFGLIYEKMLEEQKAAKVKETTKPPKKAKPKPKTPSKKR